MHILSTIRNGKKFSRVKQIPTVAFHSTQPYSQLNIGTLLTRRTRIFCSSVANKRLMTAVQHNDVYDIVKRPEKIISICSPMYLVFINESKHKKFCRLTFTVG